MTKTTETNPAQGHSFRRQTDALNAPHPNARSLKAPVPSNTDCTSKQCKITLLQHLVYSATYDIVCICETWLNATVLSSELLPGYSIFWRDRVGKIGGGVLVAVKNNIHATRRPDLEKENTEFAAVELALQNCKSTLLDTFYRPPDSCPDAIQHLNSSLQDAPESSCVILIGDPNPPAANWSLDHPTPTVNGSQLEEMFCDLVGDNFLQQFITGPTHVRGNTLDLLLCNCPEIIKNVTTWSPDQYNFPSDHYTAEPETQQAFNRANAVTRNVFDHKRGSFDELRSFLTHNPLETPPSDNLNECWLQWKDWFLNAAHKFVPIKNVKDANSPPWIDGEVMHFIRKKYSALKKYRKCRTDYRKRKLRKISQTIKYLVKRKHRDYLLKIQDSFQDNPRLFWSYHKAVFHHRSTQTPAISYKGKLAKTPSDKAELFNSYFSSVFQPSRPNQHQTPTPPPSQLRTDTQLREIELSEHDAANCLRNPDTSKASGPDGIPARPPKECSQQIVPSPCPLPNLSLQSSRTPPEWKSADAAPIHKRDSKEPAENYRPIPLLSIVSKVPERCVYFRPHDHILHHISQAQHGFLRKRSCVTQLLSVFHTIGHDLDKNIQTDVLYLDPAKAFDSADHAIVLEKPRGYGVTGPAPGWFADYSNGRTQRVVVDGVAPTRPPVTSGVPQGSTPGPLLFVIPTNDLPDAAQNGTETAMHADDTKPHNTITSTDDCKRPQQSLTNLNCWSVQNNTRFNASKRKALTITRKKTPVTYDYKLGTESLTRVDSEKDLGVITSSGLSWELQINCVISKANKMLGAPKRTCTQPTDMKARRTPHPTHVKSQLCYATEVRPPANNIQLPKRIERVQRRATRWIMMSRRGELSYKERLLALDLLPLTPDREVKDLVFLHKALFGYVNVNVDVSNCVSPASHGLTRLSNTPKYILQSQICRTSTFQSSYYNRVTKLWNAVCKDVCLDTVSSPSSFKCLVKRRYSSIVDSIYDVDLSCTWSLFRDCSCHRTQTVVH